MCICIYIYIYISTTTAAPLRTLAHTRIFSGARPYVYMLLYVLAFMRVNI